MGNAVSGSKKAKVMKIDGETFNVKTPATANDVVKDYPGYALLDSKAVKHFGLRAKPLEPHYELKPKNIYFLVELPKFQPEPNPRLQRRVRSSAIRGMHAMERLNLLMLSERSVSDVSLVKPKLHDGPGLVNDGSTKVRMRLPKAQFERLMKESHDGTEVAEKIISLYMEGNNAAVNGSGEASKEVHNQRSQRKRVSFSPVEEEEILKETSQIYSHYS